MDACWMALTIEGSIVIRVNYLIIVKCPFANIAQDDNKRSSPAMSWEMNSMAYHALALYLQMLQAFTQA